MSSPKIRVEVEDFLESSNCLFIPPHQTIGLTQGNERLDLIERIKAQCLLDKPKGILRASRKIQNERHSRITYSQVGIESDGSFCFSNGLIMLLFEHIGP